MTSTTTAIPLPEAVALPEDTTKPELGAAEALAIAAAHFAGLEGSTGVRELPSERDRNFLLESPDGTRRVLRVSSPDSDGRVLALQNAALERLAASGVAAPRLVAGKDGAVEVRVELPSGPSAVRLFTWVDGTPLAEVKPHPDGLLASCGALLAETDLALADLEPGFERRLDWDLLQAGEVIAARLPFVPGGGRPPLERALEAFTEIAPRLASLPRQLIHNDGNDWNLLVRYRDGVPWASGLIDFGDIVTAPRVCEVAIAAAYAGLGKGRPEHAAAALLAGYQRVAPLSADEIALLPALIETRLAVSVATSAWRRKAGKLDPYLSISEQQAWESLERLQGRSRALLEAIFRVAAGFDAHRHAARTLAHLRAAGGASASPVDADLRREPVALIELGVEGADVAELDDENDPRQLDALCRRLEAKIGARVSAGGYGEARPVYLTDAFAVPGSDRRERRTIHLGVDFFQPAGRPIYAPLAGRIHSLADNAEHGDYGPTLLLEHDLPAAPGEEQAVFYSLYGHLSRESLAGKEAGQSVAQGEQIGTLGAIEVNGGWAPHLHFQLMLDLLGRRGEFPGVAAPSEREVWLGLCPDPNLLFGIPEYWSPSEPEGAGEEVLQAAAGPRIRSLAPPVPGLGELLERRRRATGANVSLSFREPLHIVRGRGVHLIDSLGNAYLDTVNNVAHVGHCHPAVLRAGRRQMALLNTNTRYLHEGLLRYSERLAATLPPGLSVGFFVCSGSEANDLAWRLARAATGGSHALVLEGAYHGHTELLIDLSPYKFARPGGEGRRSWVEVLPLPDVYRQPERDFAAEAAAAIDAAAAAGRKPAALFAEAILSCGGQVELPAGYLAAAAAACRRAGGLYVADEVQTGFGRVGSHFWAFESHGVTPDIVTLGKPMGNGHPLAAVFTTPEIAAAFAGGMEYFNTFGGNPVSCAIGEAVLDAIAGEGLQARAAEVGGFLAQGLRELAARHERIGDVRGRGLFLGAELVTDREGQSPATREARYVAERMKERGILISLDGPHGNVIKIKPPLVFSRQDAERFLETLDEVLAEDLVRPASLEP